MQHDTAYLGPVAMGDDNVVSRFDDVGDVGRSLFYHFQLRFSRCRLSCFLERVPAQGDHYPLHMVPF